MSARERTDGWALRRSLSSYSVCSSEAISAGSQAMVRFFIDDAKHDIAVLSEALKNFTEGRDISYANALVQARAALGEKNNG